MTKAEPRPDEIDEGAANLLRDCAGLGSGDSLLLVHEDPALGWWQADLMETLARAAENFGIRLQQIRSGPPTNTPDAAVQKAMHGQPCTLFLARIGDQDRFAAPLPGQRRIMCYIRDTRMLGSSFGRVPFQAMKTLKLVLDQAIFAARRIEISCPLGTRLCSTFNNAEKASRAEPADVSILRFPLGIVSPVPAANFSGRAIMSHYLTPTGSAVYEPAVLGIDSPVAAQIERGLITGFEGDAVQIDAIDKHYRRIARLFGLDPFIVHSWHAGIHPGAACSLAESDNPDLWGNTVFNHPRYLHFHSCGANPPGEISWMLRDHSVLLDDVPLWEEGRLRPENFAAACDCLVKWPALEALYGDGYRVEPDPTGD